MSVDDQVRKAFASMLDEREFEDQLIASRDLTRGDRRFRQKAQRRKSRRFAVAAVAAVLVTGTAVAAPAMISHFREDEDAAKQVSALTSQHDTRDITPEMRHILDNFQGTVSERGVPPGSLKLEDASVLISRDDEAPFDMVAVPTTVGQVCYAMMIDRGATTDCEPPFTRDRPGSALSAETDSGAWAFGVVADGVRDVQVEADGAIRSAYLKNNVYWLSVDKPSEFTSAIATLDDGSTATLGR